MQLSVRPYATAGVALVGAAVIVANPIAPPPPQIRVASPLVQPAATFGEFFENTGNSLAELIPQLTEDPLPVLRQILANTISSAQSILEPTVDLVVGGVGYAVSLPSLVVEAIQTLFAEDGGIVPAIGVLIKPLIGLLPDAGALFNAVVGAVQQPFQNIANALGTLTIPNLLQVGLSFVSPLIATAIATVDAVQAVVGGVFGDGASFNAFVRSVVDFVPTIADGFFNGYPNAIEREFNLPFPLPDVTLNGSIGGLLSTGAFDLKVGLGGATVDLATSGPIAGVNNYLQKLAEAITPPAPTTAKSAQVSAPDETTAKVAQDAPDETTAKVAQDAPDETAAANDAKGVTAKPVKTAGTTLKKLGENVKKGLGVAGKRGPKAGQTSGVGVSARGAGASEGGEG